MVINVVRRRRKINDMYNNIVIHNKTSCCDKSIQVVHGAGYLPIGRTGSSDSR